MFVDEAVAFQAVHLSGSQHKLPQAGSTDARPCGGVEGGFDNGQISEFKRQAVGIERFFKDRHIKVAGTQHERYVVAQAACVHINKFAYNFIVWHFHYSGNAAEAVDIDRVAEKRILCGRAAIFA